MRILGIESSCDETAASLVEDGRTVLQNSLASTQEIFASQGGVIPEEAAREQVRVILPVLRHALGSTEPKTIDAIAVTKGPGLLGSLLVGVTAARSLASLWGAPLIGVHHTLGHLSSTWLEQPLDDAPRFPVLTLSASGGHTDLWLRQTHTKGQLLGRTRDDAAGEAFDKGASILGLSYPGGPSIAKAAETGDPQAFSFPLPLRSDPGYDWSFSGLKTALKYTVRDTNDWESRQSDLAASYQEAICRHLTDRLAKALQDHPEVQEVHLVGGVSANFRLRELTQQAIGERRLRTPAQIRYCTDNAAMIAAAGYFLFCESPNAARDTFLTQASLPLEEVVRS